MTVFANPTFTADYQSLCNKIADTLNRQDLNAVIPDFTVLATKRIERDMTRVKHPMSIIRANATVVQNYVPVPLDFIAVYQMMDQDTTVTLDYVSPDQSKEVLAQGWNSTSGPYSNTLPSVASSGGPIYYTIIGTQFRIFPPPGVSAPVYLDLWYYARLAALNTTNTTNWVLTRYPDLYLYGSLVHSAPYLKADERIQTWEAAYQTILRDIEVEADRAVRSQSKLNAARKSF